MTVDESENVNDYGVSLTGGIFFFDVVSFLEWLPDIQLKSYTTIKMQIWAYFCYVFYSFQVFGS